jgi:hypothetical protein
MTITTTINDLPDMVLHKIAYYITEETPFRNKSDVVKDSCCLAIAGIAQLSNEILFVLDPSANGNKLSPLVHKNILIENNKWISINIATNVWGVTEENMTGLPKRQLILKSTTVYRLRDVRKISEMKFDGSYEKLKTFNTKQQLKRLTLLKKAVNEYNISIRLDSKCCDNYIKNNRGQPENIARLLKETEFYHIFTNYNKLFGILAGKYYSEYGYVDHDHVNIDAKKKALNDFIRDKSNKIDVIPKSLFRFIPKKHIEQSDSP